MRIVNVNCSAGKTVIWKGQAVQTGIFKTPVLGRVDVRKLNIEGDRQSDLTVHGGADKAVYSYDVEDYAWWNLELGRELQPGAFGENLTTEGLLDREVFVGDVLKAGTAVLQAIQPRLPCYKLGVKFEDDRMPKRFVKAQRWGVYFRVLEEGTLEAGDAIEFLSRNPQRVRIADLARLAIHMESDPKLIRRALEIASLTPGWKEMLMEMESKRES